MGWISLTSEEFFKEYDTYVIAYCLDTDEFFVTNQRYWWWQYQKEFSNEQDGINYFENHLDEFFQIANELRKYSGFYSSLKDKDLFLENTNRFYGGGQMTIEKGWYRHFKGGYYYVIDTAIHTETGEEMVIYYHRGEPQKLWVRPASMWHELVNGIPRFESIVDSDFF